MLLQLRSLFQSFFFIKGKLTLKKRIHIVSFFAFFLNGSRVGLQCLLVSCVQQSESVIHISIYSFLKRFPDRLLQDTD